MKRQLREHLTDGHFQEIARMAARRKRVLGDLVSLTYDADPLIAWRAVEAMGMAAARVAETNPEFVRGHLRRLRWLLSEESGGICRHAPQAMAEIVVRNPGLFDDYGPIVVSLLNDMAEEDLASGFRKAVLWAIGRLAPHTGAEIDEALPAITAGLDDPDPLVRGTAAWCLLRLGRRDLLTGRDNLAVDDTPIELYENGDFVTTSVRALVASFPR